MHGSVTIFLLLAGTFGAALPGAAQTVYRCGESYSQQPCPGGKAVQADDPRTEAQRIQTREATQRDAKAADEMQKARLKEEAKPAQAVIPAPKPEALDPPPPVASPGVAKKPAHFTAVSPAKKDKGQTNKKKKKAKKKAAATPQSS